MSDGNCGVEVGSPSVGVAAGLDEGVGVGVCVEVGDDEGKGVGVGEGNGEGEGVGGSVDAGTL